ncbi:unnamed protein product, partial [Acidithrix sp. C25]
VKLPKTSPIIDTFLEQRQKVVYLNLADNAEKLTVRVPYEFCE